MTVPFNVVPSTMLAPFFYAEFNSGGSPFQALPRLLLQGQKLTAGTAVADKVVGPVQSENEIIALTGLGSMLHFMYKIARVNAPAQGIWIQPLADPAGAAATGKISIGVGAAGTTGYGLVRILGRRIIIQINAADSRANIATNLTAAINAANLPVIAAVDGTNNYEVDITARHVGALSNGQDVSVPAETGNLFTATTVTITALSGGTGTPALTTALANLGAVEYDWIAAPYADATSLNSVRDLLDNATGRWGPLKQLYGHYTTAFFDTLANCVTLGSGRNDPHVSIVGSQRSPTPEWEWAAALGAVEVLHLANPPELSRPLQTLVLAGVVPPDDKSKWWTTPDVNSLIGNGISACTVTPDGQVAIARICTTYRLSAAGVPDATLRDIETMAQGMYSLRYIRQAISNRHARQALADENPHNVAEITTPRDLKNTAIHAYEDLVALGVAENLDVFVRYVRVERNLLDANRADFFFPVDFVNQLRVAAVNMTAYLQYQTPGGGIAIA